MRAVVVCGAKIKDYEFVCSYFKDDDFFIYCDSGLKHENDIMSTTTEMRCNSDIMSTDEKLSCAGGIMSTNRKELGRADLIIGDFDSHEYPDGRDVEIIKLPREKDDTDSVYAVKEAVKRGFDSFLMVGVIGDRLDHGLVNVYALIYLYENNIDALIVDDFSEMKLIGNRKSESVEKSWPYFSLVAIAGEAKGVTIKNAKYELEDAVIKPSYQYATSNEPLNDSGAEDALISVKDGYLLLMKDR